MWNTAGVIVYFACQWLITLIVVWLYDDFTNAGNLALAMNITNVFFCIAGYNVRTYQVSDIRSEYTDSVYIVTRFITCFGATVLCAVFTLLLGYPLEQVLIILLYMCYRSVEAFIDVLHGIDHKHGRLDYAGISMIARGFLMLTAFSLLGWVFDLLHAIIGMVIITAMFGIIFDVPKARKLVVSAPCTRQKVWGLLKRCFPLMIVAVMITFLPAYARYSLERIHGTEALGAYSTAIAPAIAVQLATNLMLAPLMTLFTVCIKESNRRRFFKIFAITCSLIAGLTLTACFAARIAGQWGLELLFGAIILPYAYLLSSAVVAMGMTAFLWVMIVIFTTVRDIKGIFFGCLAGIVVCIASMEVFIEEAGLVGTNYAMITCQGVTLFILCVRLFWKSGTIANSETNKVA